MKAAPPSELVAVDAGLPAAVRLAGVRLVARGAARGQRHAAAGGPELLQPEHGSVPEADGGVHRPDVHLRGQRVLPVRSGAKRPAGRFEPPVLRPGGSAALELRPPRRRPHSFPVQRLPVRFPASLCGQTPAAPSLAGGAAVLRAAQPEAHLPVRGSGLRGLPAEELLLHTGPQRRLHQVEELQSAPAARSRQHRGLRLRSVLRALRRHGPAASGAVPALPLQEGPLPRLLGPQRLGPLQPAGQRPGAARCPSEAAGGGGASSSLHDRRFGSGVPALGPPLRHARRHTRLHAALHPAGAGVHLPASSRCAGFPALPAAVRSRLLHVRLARPREGHPARHPAPQLPGGREQRGCWDISGPDHHRSLLAVPADLHPRRAAYQSVSDADVHHLLFHGSQETSRPGSAASPGVRLPAGPRCRGAGLRGGLPAVAVATEAALPPPAGHLGVLLPGRLPLLPAPVRQPAAAGGGAHAAVSGRRFDPQSQNPRNTQPPSSCTRAPEQGSRR